MGTSDSVPNAFTVPSTAIVAAAQFGVPACWQYGGLSVMDDQRLLLDESGQREFGRKTSNYFVVAGVACAARLERRLDDELSGLKRAHFKTCGVEIKSDWLRIPDERQKQHLDKYGIHEQRLVDFCYSLYDWVLATPLTLFAGVVDKVQLQATYTRPHPSGLAYGLVLQCYQKFLAKQGVRGDVVLDNTSGKTPAGNEW